MDPKVQELREMIKSITPAQDVDGLFEDLEADIIESTISGNFQLGGENGPTPTFTSYPEKKKPEGMKLVDIETGEEKDANAEEDGDEESNDKVESVEGDTMEVTEQYIEEAINLSEVISGMNEEELDTFLSSLSEDEVEYVENLMNFIAEAEEDEEEGDGEEDDDEEDGEEEKKGLDFKDVK